MQFSSKPSCFIFEYKNRTCQVDQKFQIEEISQDNFEEEKLGGIDLYTTRYQTLF